MQLISATYHRPRRVRGPRGQALGTLALALAALALGAPAALASPETLVIDGAGDGHGVGMSQEGALGYAEHGASYEQILAHYYTGTALGQAPAGRMVKVLVGTGSRPFRWKRTCGGSWRRRCRRPGRWRRSRRRRWRAARMR